MAKRGRKPGGVNFKTTIRLEQIAVLEAKGLLDAEIARHMQLSPGGLATLKRNPYYGMVKARLQTGVVGALEQDLGQNREYVVQRLKNMLPPALKELAELITNPDPRVRLSAIGEVLDREGQLAKVSRIGVPTEAQGGVGFDTSRADALVASLTGGAKP